MPAEDTITNFLDALGSAAPAPGGGAACALALYWSPASLLQAVPVVGATAILYLAVMYPTLMRSPLGEYGRSILELFRGKYLALQRAWM